MDIYSKFNTIKVISNPNDDFVDEDDYAEDEDPIKKKDKKLVFLSRSVLEKIREKPMTTGTQIANEILELYRKFCEVCFTND